MGAAVRTQQLLSATPARKASCVTVCANRGVTPVGWGLLPATLAEPMPPPHPPAICGLGALIFGGIIRHLGMEKAAQGSQQTVLRPVGAATLDQTGPCWRLSQNSQLA